MIYGEEVVKTPIPNPDGTASGKFKEIVNPVTISDETKLNNNQISQIKKFIKSQKIGNNCTINIEGHADYTGSQEHNDKISLFTDLYVDHCTTNIYKLFPKEGDAKIADAILELFRKRDDLEVFNKKALYIYIREMVDAKTPKITKISDKLYDIYRNSYVFYLENGYIKF